MNIVDSSRSAVYSRFTEKGGGGRGASLSFDMRRTVPRKNGLLLDQRKVTGVGGKII